MAAEFELQESTTQQKSKGLSIKGFGTSLALTWLGTMLWCPKVVPQFCLEAGLELRVHMLRLLVIFVVFAVYFLAQYFPQVFFNRKLKFAGMIICTILSPFVLLTNVIPEMSSFCQTHPAVLYLFWAFAGLYAAVATLAWEYDISTKADESQGVANASFAFILAGAFYILIQFLMEPAATILVMAIPLCSLITWIVCISRDDSTWQSPLESDREVSQTGVHKELGKGANIFIFSYGFVMGVAGAIGTLPSTVDITFAIAGVASIAAGLTVLLSFRYAQAVSKKFFYIFLPLIVICLFLISFVGVVAKIICLCLMFYAALVCNASNTTFISPSSEGHSKTDYYGLFKGESRTFDLLGTFLGWGISTIIVFLVDSSYVIYCYFFLAVILVSTLSVALVGSVRSGGSGKSAEHSTLDVGSSRWRSACKSIENRCGLSERESEVFYLLSRGRNCQYIHDVLFISPSTVRTHAYSIYRKLNIDNQQQLIDVVEAELAALYEQK